MAALRGKGATAQLMERVRKRIYRDNDELSKLLEQIFASPGMTPEQVMWMLSSGHPMVREMSLLYISSMTGASPESVLLKAMQSATDRARHDMAKEIVRGDEERVVKAITPLLHARDPEHRRIALDVISEFPRWVRFASTLAKCTRDPDGRVREKAVRVLGRGARKRSVRPLLVDLLHSSESDVRREAIQALANHPGVDLVEPFFARLPHEGRVERDMMTRTLSALAQNPKARLEEYLLPILADENPRMREVAVNLLGRMPNRARILRAYFKHSQGLATWLRDRTTESILKLSTSLSEPLAELLFDKDNDVRVGAMMMVRESNDKSFIPMVRKLFEQEEDWWVRSLAIEVLTKFPTPDLLDTLLEDLDDPDLKFSIISALGQLPGPKATDSLFTCLDDSDRGVRIATLEALAHKKTPQVAESLFLVACHDAENKVREKAAAVLLGMGNLARGYEDKLEQIATGAEDGSGEIVELTMVNEELNARPPGSMI